MGIKTLFLNAVHDLYIIFFYTFIYFYLIASIVSCSIAYMRSAVNLAKAAKNRNLDITVIFYSVCIAR